MPAGARRLRAAAARDLGHAPFLEANQIFEDQFDFSQAVFYQSPAELPEKLDFIFKNDKHVRVGIFQPEEAFLNRQACSQKFC